MQHDTHTHTHMRVRARIQIVAQICKKAGNVNMRLFARIDETINEREISAYFLILDDAHCAVLNAFRC